MSRYPKHQERLLEEAEADALAAASILVELTPLVHCAAARADAVHPASTLERADGSVRARLGAAAGQRALRGGLLGLRRWRGGAQRRRRQWRQQT
jgi:hypothetical protein